VLIRSKTNVRAPALEMGVSISVPRSKRVSWLRRLKRKLFRRKEPEVAAPPPIKVGEAMRRALPEAAAPHGPGAGEHRDDLHDRRTKLEARFLQTLIHRDADAELLPELAGLHAQQGNSADAAICWLNALWEKEDAPDYWWWGW